MFIEFKHIIHWTLMWMVTCYFYFMLITCRFLLLVANSECTLEVTMAIVSIHCKSWFVNYKATSIKTLIYHFASLQTSLKVFIVACVNWRGTFECLLPSVMASHCAKVMHECLGQQAFIVHIKVSSLQKLETWFILQHQQHQIETMLHKTKVCFIYIIPCHFVLIPIVNCLWFQMLKSLKLKWLQM